MSYLRVPARKNLISRLDSLKCVISSFKWTFSFVFTMALYVVREVLSFFLERVVLVLG